MGWRSQENVSDGRALFGITPSQRLSESLRKSKVSGSLGTGLPEESSHTNSRKESYNCDWYINDSIKSVSFAIAEYCKVSCDEKSLSTKERIARRQVNRNRNGFRPSKVWMESSFLSSAININIAVKKIR